APPITSPTTGTVWTVGQTVTVTWDTSELPPPQNITNISGKILLGFLDDGDDSEHLDVDSPLAQGFNITTGSVQLTVPNVPAKDDYIIVLFGDSGNLSPKFTI
ncbi:hypothetical protein PUNSTDRAFT_19047, partial [Punctularia strigosozonata HHB-11173 SS5]|uniref:uncharacterized protein n=1 Tax=Punctularia strigosozonata (strain HHB-11173) TaxID=741275 RepID=UPI00044163C4